MKAKLLAVLLLAITIGSIGISTATSNNSSTKVKETPNKTTMSVSVASANKAQQNSADEPGVIKGAKNPALIPDKVAYSLLFRLVSGRQDVEAKKRIRNYVKQTGLGDCRCPGQKPEDKGDDKDIDVFIAAAGEFQQRVSVLDQQVVEIKTRNWPNPSLDVMAQLTQLQRQKEALVAEIVSSLPNRLSANGMKKLQTHITERVKKNVNIKQRGQANASSLALLSENNPTR